MCRMSCKFILLLLGSLFLAVSAAPHSMEREETDPELTAGYFQGDMNIAILRNGIIAPTRHWPNATVYYMIDEEFDDEHVEHLEKAMRLIESTSCIRFVPATEEDPDFVFIGVSAFGCNSNVGYIGGPQFLQLTPHPLGTKCFRLGVIQHELLHTLGFFHQQSSSNRDDFIQVIEENIIENKKRAFHKYNDDRVGNFNADYDYGSVMHYGPKAFSKNGEPTMIALDPEGQSQMGQRRGLSSADIIRLNTMYNCSAV